MIENDKIPVNSKVLVWARESIGQSRNHVVEKTGINLRRLNQIENGEKHPGLEELKLLAKTYKRTIATLLLREAPQEKPLPKDRRTIDSKDIGKFHEKTILAVRKARAFTQSLIELKTDAGIAIPKFKYSASVDSNVDELAQTIRTDLNLNEIRELENINDILEAYIDKVESLGVAVFQMSLTQDNLRGFSIIDEDIPIIGIKRGSEKPTSKIFTLFHELGHIVLNRGGLCDLSIKTTSEIEKWCNAFAAEILIPKSDLLSRDIVQDYKYKQNKVWLKKDLIELSNYFHVGPLAILRSLLTNKLTTSKYYNEKHQVWNKPSFGRSKNPKGRDIAKETIREKGKNYISLAFSAYDKNRIDIKDLSDFLGVKLSYIPKTRELLNSR
ncbi:XRE family transcriptional regulator [Muricauda sp. SCSIO 64092]|uniref:ImmA/IrrE family metallo-endopeptidase n=1 Tax=Allomuricauda sp. SCSIO 64092 TaxID=2908842 RepID=UPI001FF6D8DF|nr:XRE family transcriptional regulator [Muricauda sp. SCSIO 64092]UOY07053.1 XRE family transcriptional regulator [Muricauda sp. SCSIO 64092]